MAENVSNVEVKPGSERGFGFVFGVVFLIVGLWPLLGGQGPRLWALGIALGFVGLALIAPAVFKVPNRLWFKFGMLLGSVVAPVVMFLVYVTTFVPIGFALRLWGKDLLNVKLDLDGKSYWIDRTDPPQSMKNQF
ncbi:SxtJ family membrane protein [Pelagibius sp.]|uniref:SxtJ family membrane protein n=1 Tax=Pelagibius sp. TaxID=1931238 RepID=UPI003B50E368